MQPLHNISSDWNGSTRFERRFMQRLLEREGTGQAIVYFSQHCKQLSDYCYWYTLGTLWVNYSGWSELKLWRKLFSSSRAGKYSSLMKPDEYALFQQMPAVVTAYRAHRTGEVDWISYTLDPQIAARFAVERGVSEVVEYAVPRDAVLALFLRRGEKELLVLDRGQIERRRVIEVVKTG